MKKKLSLIIFSLILIYGCSTNNGSNNPVPNPPTNLVGHLLSGNKIIIEWQDNSTDETGFKIERKNGIGNYVVIATIDANLDFSAFYDDVGLTPDTYTYKVCSVNSNGNSSTYSNESTITISPPPTVTDIDGNLYYFTTICTQNWTTSNLNVSKYRNGDVIPQVTDAAQWSSLTKGAWCYYNNDQATGAIYGKLYNWYAVTDPRGLAPIGYHIPTAAEFNTLKSCAGYNGAGGGKLKEGGTLHWTSPNLAINTDCMTCTTPADNRLGFSALPGAYRSANGLWNFNSIIGNYGIFWSSSDCVNMTLKNSDPYIYIETSSSKKEGFSVRCVKD